MAIIVPQRPAVLFHFTLTAMTFFNSQHMWGIGVVNGHALSRRCPKEGLKSAGQMERIPIFPFLLSVPPHHIHLSDLEHLFKGDRSLVREWIDLYLQESPTYFDLLAVSLSNGDAQALASAAHDLQPQAHYLSAASMLQLLASIEEQATNGDLRSCGELLTALLPVREAIDAELRAVLNAI